MKALFAKFMVLYLLLISCFEISVPTIIGINWDDPYQFEDSHSKELDFYGTPKDVIERHQLSAGTHYVTRKYIYLPDDNFYAGNYVDIMAEWAKTEWMFEYGGYSEYNTTFESYYNANFATKNKHPRMDAEW